jgi:hypothetical protein
MPTYQSNSHKIVIQDTDTMTFEDTRTTQKWQLSTRWLFLIPVLLAAGTLSAILTVANPPQGFADIRAGSGIPHFTSDAPVFNPPEFDAYHVEEAHEMAPGRGEIE